MYVYVDFVNVLANLDACCLFYLHCIYNAFRNSFFTCHVQCFQTMLFIRQHNTDNLSVIMHAVRMVFARAFHKKTKRII